MFMDTRLPVQISLGSSGGLSFQTDIVVYSDGKEYSNSRWAYQKTSFDLSYVVKNRAQAVEVYNFFQAAKGRANTFRVKDYLDYTSGPLGTDTPTALDNQIGIGDGSNITFQLSKTYSTGITSTTRPITKPVDGTVLVAIDGTPTTNFTVDTSAGIITLGTIPTTGQVITAGFEFDIHCRFDTDSLENIQYTLLRKDSERDYISFPSLPIVEVL